MSAPPPDPVYMIKGDMGPIHSLLFYTTPCVEHIYAGTESGAVHIWNLQNNRELSKLSSSEGSCLSLHNFDDEYLLTQRKNGNLNIWKAHNSDWEINKTIETDYHGFCRCQKSTENTMFLPLDNSKIGFFSLNSQSIEMKLDPLCFPDIKTLGDVMAMKPFNSFYVFAAHDSGQILLWDIRQKKVLSTLCVGPSPMTIDFDTSSMNGVIGNPSNTLKIFSLSKNSELSEKQTLPLKNSGTSVVKIRPDARILATGGWDGRIRINSWKKFKPLAVLDPHKTTIHDIIYSSMKIVSYNNNYLMAAAAKDGYISLWNLYN